MGSTFRLPVATGRLGSVLPDARREGLRVVATVAQQGEAPTAALLASPVLVLLGNEGAGLPADVLAACDARVTVPMRTGVDSLNVAVTAAILLWEAAGGGHRR
jgi:TrmH family RNA methyltransferase